MMIGIVIYSAANNTLGLLTLIPLYFAWRLVRKTPTEDTSDEPGSSKDS